MLRLFRALAVSTLILLGVPGIAVAAQPGITPLGASPEELPTFREALGNAPSGGKWVRMFMDWSQLQPTDGPIDPYNQLADFDRRIDGYKSLGLMVTAVVTKAPPWVDVNSAEGANRYAVLMEALASRYAGRVDVWEVWNEPDESIFWPGGPKPAEYTRLLKAAYAAVKGARGVDPANTLVITGGMTGNNYDFLAKLYADGAKNSLDGVGVHTDTACLLRDPGFYYRETSGRIGRFSFTGYREVYETMKAHGDGDKQIYMTEIGWAEAVGTGFAVPCDQGVDAGRKNGGVTRAEQAEFMKQAYACLAADPFVRMASWFTLVDGGDYRTGVHGYGLIDSDGKRRPIYEAMKVVGDGTGAGVNPGCGARIDTDKPNVVIDVPDVFYSRLQIKGSATDPTTPVRQIELWVDGERVAGVNQDGGKYDLDWFGSTKLGYGKHTIELRARDEAANVGIAAKAVTKVNPAKSSGTVTPRLTFTPKKKGRKIRISARVLRALELAEEPRGRLRIFFERKVKKRWKPTSRYTKGISKPIRLTYLPKKKGTWRVWARLGVDVPYKSVRTKKFVFRIR